MQEQYKQSIALKILAFKAIHYLNLKHFKMNRNFPLLVLFVSLLVFSACKKEKDPTPETVSGTYTLTSIVPSKALDPEADGTFGDTELIDNITCPSKLIIDDTNGATYQFVNLNQSFTPNPMNNDYYALDCQGDTYPYTYTLTDNSLTMTIDQGSEIIIFSVISATELHYEFSTVQEFPVEENGSVVSKEISLTYKFTK